MPARRRDSSVAVTPGILVMFKVPRHRRWHTGTVVKLYDETTALVLGGGKFYTMPVTTLVPKKRGRDADD